MVDENKKKEENGLEEDNNQQIHEEKKPTAEKNGSNGQSSEKENYQEKLEELEKEREELYSRLQRLQADFDNYRKRVKAERQEIKDFALIELAEKLLPVLDNLERAVYYTQEEASEESLREGVMMVYRQFKDALAKEGIVPIECKGKPFDPCFHEAVVQEEAKGVPSQTVVDELQKGYKLNDKVIRASMVKVSK